MAQKSVYVRFQVPKEAVDKAYSLLQVAKDTGKLRKGTNESTKAIERGIAKLVIIAEDVEPPQVVAHLPILCEERKIAYLYVPSKLELGKSAGLDVGSAAISVVEPGDGAQSLKDLLKIVENNKKTEAGKTDREKTYSINLLNWRK